MIRRVLSPRLAGPALAAVLAFHAGAARAQMGPMGGPGGGAPGGGAPMGGGSMGGEEKKNEGIAEAAPKTPGLLPTTPTLPPPKSHRKRLQVLELDGYMRVRTNWFHNFNLGFVDDPAQGGAPFPQPLGCPRGNPQAAQSTPCGDSISDADMRLRLEPTLNIDESTAVHAQIDLLDNQILGGTPEGTYLNGLSSPGNIPLGAFSNSQVAPTAGVNDIKNSITVKRAWAEVGTPLGLLEFGRMPDQWGLGILHNGGGYDPINGTYNFDADHGDQVDRIAFSTLIPGTRIKAMAAIDWPNSGLLSSVTNSGTGAQTGQVLDLDDDDDVTQYSVVVSQTNTPQEFKDAIDRGETVYNWGLYAQQRTQGWAYAGNFTIGGTPVAGTPPTTTTGGTTTQTTGLVNRNYKAYVFDPWFKIGKGNWLFEGEGVGVIGSVGTLADYCTPANQGSCAQGKINIYQFGGVARGRYAALDGRLRVGIESGYASGDQYDSQALVDGQLRSVPGYTNVEYAHLIPAPGDSNMTQFIFDPDYQIDLILFRHLLGAVTNALYFKPKLEFDLSKNFGFRVWNVTSFAARPVATPGNGQMYGIEFDGDIGYHSSTFDAGIAYGALFPLGALSHPADDLTTNGGPGFGYGVGGTFQATNVGDGTTAQTVQIHLIVRF